MAEKSSSYLERKHFLDDLRDLNRDGAHFCFILGSGASLSSGIPTGQKMMRDWYDNFLSKKTNGEMHSLCERTEVPWKSWERICQPDYNFPSEDYFTFYDLRYGRNPREGKRYLTRKMREAQPSLGYDLLSKLMNGTGNNVVITTNFDHLTEESFTLNHLGFPQVLDPNTAHEMQGMPLEYPLIAKVHGDAMLNPLNRSGELKELAPVWLDKLPAIFANYIPIVIGYGGGDRTLMAYLKRCTWLKQVYWCSMGEQETDTIEQFLQAEDMRYLVPMNRVGSSKETGFDGIMAEIYDALMSGEGAKPAETPAPKLSKIVPVDSAASHNKAPEPEPPKQAVAAKTPAPAPQEQKKPLAVLSGDKIFNLTNKGTIEVLVFRDSLSGAPKGAEDFSEAGYRDVLCWRENNTLTIAGAGGVAAPRSCSELFEDWEALRTVTGAELLDTSGVTDMRWMFLGCRSLQTLDVDSWDTGKVTNMRAMFYGCSSLQKLNVSSWDTGKVTNMCAMFADCKSLQKLDVSKWNTEKVTNMREMFAGTRWESNPPIKKNSPLRDWLFG